MKFLIISLSLAAGLLAGCIKEEKAMSDNMDYTIRSVSAEQTDQIKSGLEEGINIANLRAVKSTHHKNGWYVAGQLQGPGVNGAVGCWMISGDKNNPGMILSVNRIAAEFTPFPDGSTTGAKTSVADEEYQALNKSYKS